MIDFDYQYPKDKTKYRSIAIRYDLFSYVMSTFTGRVKRNVEVVFRNFYIFIS